MTSVPGVEQRLHLKSETPNRTMAKCDLSIEIPNPKEQYLPGDLVDVTVHVDTSDRVTCKRLSLELGWRTHGAGNGDTGVSATQTLFVGEWAPADEESHKTDVVIPDLSADVPASYHGHHINVDWYLLVRADIPWAIDPKAEQRIFVAPHTQGLPAYEEPGIWPTESVKLSGKSGCLIALTIFAIIAGTGALFFNPWPAAVFFGGGAVAVHYALKERALRRLIGEVGFGFVPDRPAMGGDLHGFVQIAPPGKLEVESVKMTLSATEVAVSGSGTRQTTHRHVAFTQSSVQAEHHSIESGDMLELDFPFEVPKNLSPSFKAGHNRVDWTLAVEVKAQGAKELTSTKKLVVGHVGVQQ